MSDKHPLKRWRESKGLTGSDLGSLIAVSKATVSRYERGRIPCKSVMARILVVTSGAVTANDFHSFCTIPPQAPWPDSAPESAVAA